jgi:uncharacterized protein (DUF1697 family)
MTRYVALLRGINVGGRNLIRMTDLAACFEAGGFADVATYIQSGNVLFSAAGKDRAGLVRRIEAMLAAAFAYDASVVLRNRRQMQGVVRRAPDGFGADPAAYRYDVLFLNEPLTASTALRSVPVRDGVDSVAAGAGVLYYTRLISRASQSQLSRLVSMPVYRHLTIRNWKTTTKLLELMGG